MRPPRVLPPSVGWDPKDMMRLSCVAVPIAGTSSECRFPPVSTHEGMTSRSVVQLNTTRLYLYPMVFNVNLIFKIPRVIPKSNSENVIRTPHTSPPPPRTCRIQAARVAKNVARFMLL